MNEGNEQFPLFQYECLLCSKLIWFVSSQSTGLCAQKEVGGGGTSCLMFATWKQYGNFCCCSQFPLPLDSRGILQKKGKCTGERNVEDFIHQTAVSRKLGLDWQVSPPHKAHFLLGKERPTMTRFTWSLCPLSCFSQFLDQITEVFSFGVHQTLLSFHRSL